METENIPGSWAIVEMRMMTMTEIKPDYINANTSTGVSAPASEDYWRKIAYKERTRADDNLRLAAERANAIQELKDQLTEANEEIERLKGIIREVEWVLYQGDWDTYYICRICGRMKSLEHAGDCPFYRWKGGE